MMGPPPWFQPQQQSAPLPFDDRGATDGGILVKLTAGFLTWPLLERDNGARLWTFLDCET